MIGLTFLLALREVRRNLLRSMLTTLGVVIGVGAVIAMVTIGQGATAQVQREVSALGENVLMVMPGADRRRSFGGGAQAKPFERRDVEAIRREVLGIVALSATVGRSAVLVAGNRNWSSSVTGMEEQYLDVRGLKVARGRAFSRGEYSAGLPVCVLGATPVRELFGAREPLGERVRVDRISCRVVGVLESKGQAASGNDQDDVVLMPLAAVQRRLVGNDDISMIHVKAGKDQSTTLLKGQIERLLRERRRIRGAMPDDFTVRDVQEIAAAMSSITTSLTGLLAGIAAVSLLVGGIGIMNIMLVSVTERTREIGTRLAIGALADEVLLQFLVEAIVLSTFGGILGIGLGLALSYAATAAFGLPWVVSPTVVVGSFAFSALVGVVFGYLPAQKAARLDPIEALRHE